MVSVSVCACCVERFAIKLNNLLRFAGGGSSADSVAGGRVAVFLAVDRSERSPQ